LNLESECDGVSTFRKAQKYTLAMPSQSSTLSPPNSATARMPLPKGGQTFQRATQVHPVGLYTNQGWPRDRLDKPANTLQNRAFVYLSIRPSRHGWDIHNGMVRPCSCPTGERTLPGAPKSRSTPCLNNMGRASVQGVGA